MKVRQVSLRNALPLSMLGIFVLLVVVFNWTGLRNAEQDLLDRARADALLQAEHLARSVQRDLLLSPSAVGADLSVAATEPRLRKLVVINADGAVELAQRLAWQGHPAADVVPGFSPEWFNQVAQGRQPELQIDAGGAPSSGAGALFPGL